MQPLINEIDKIIVESGESDCINSWYADDGNILAPFEIMKKIIELLHVQGPAYGYYMKKDKGAYIMGVNNAEVSKSNFEYLKDRYNFDQSICKYNPNTFLGTTEADYGCNVLGSFVGSDAYIQASLNNYILELEENAKSLIEYPNSQGRMLLFTESFCKKPLHILRTIPPSNILSDFISKFEGVKKLILSSFANGNTDDFNELVYQIINLKKSEGGIGINLLQDISPCAYVASLLHFNRDFFNLILNPDCNIPGLIDLKKSILLMKKWTTLESAVEYILKLVPGAKGSIQHQLVNIQEEFRINKLTSLLKSKSTTESTLSVRKRIIMWWRANKHEESGAWLSVKPTYETYFISNKEFNTAFCYRYYLRIEGLADGVKCSCKDGDKKYLDMQGHHLATCCPCGGTRIATHNAIVYELNSILNYCGRWTKLEEYGVFQEADPNNKMRPDISINNPVGSSKRKQLLDVSIVSPRLPNSNIIAGINAQSMFDKKNKKYAESVNSNNFDFVPFILESNGYFHPTAKLFLLKLAKIASELKKISTTTLFNYFIKRLSVRLQKSLASGINVRVLQVMSHNSAGFHDPSFKLDVILGT